MGYRSEVYVGLAVSDFCILRSTVGKRDNSSEYIVDEWVIDPYGSASGAPNWNHIDDCLETITKSDSYTVGEYGGEDYVWFMIGGIKWYDSYAPIAAFQNTLAEFEKTWGMVVIGEETDDISIFGDPWELDMNINRYVDMPGSYRHLEKPPEIQTDSVPPECGFPLNWVRIGTK